MSVSDCCRKEDMAIDREQKKLKDRIGEYLVPHAGDYIFDELSDDYLKRSGLYDILHGVPIPIRKTELTGLTNLKIARNMAVVIGCDLNFRYRDSYVAYIVRSFGRDFAKPLIREGVDSAANNDLDYACIYFRAALLIDPGSGDALYCYGRACKDSYDAGGGEEYVGRYKAESLEAFERLTLARPDFDMGFYYLGYAYLNLGLYVKAKLTWQDFLRLTEGTADEDRLKLRDEIKDWMFKLEEPVKIEAAYNLVLTGRYEEGIAALAPYTEDERFNNWWPLWYYLGIACRETEDYEAAEKCFKRVLTLSPSNIETMRELMTLYAETGDEGKAEKYEKKIALVRRNREEERAEKNSGMS